MNICTICKAQIPKAAPEAWTMPDGEVLQVSRSTIPSAIADTSVGEFEICHSCYQRGLPSFFTSQDLAEIHYEFGLEYRDRQDLRRCIESLTQARPLSETPDIVAALAHAEDELGHKETAIALYRRALEIARHTSWLSRIY